MKKISTLFCLSVLVVSAQAQLLTLRDADNNVVNGTTVIHVGAPTESVFETDLSATLEGAVGRSVNVRRYEINVAAGTQNYFCWGVCYGPQDAGAMPVWNALPQHAITMSPGVAVTNFHAYHVPMGLENCNVYRYVWYDVGNPTDTTWVDIQFCSQAVGINEAAAAQYDLTVFPNPSTGGDVRVSFTGTGATPATTFVVYNTVGERVHMERVRAAQQAVILSTADLSTGVYFATLEANGATLATRRFVVTGR
ncbi:MAG: T9SS type A sorting domain-containing protein [Flavobacteriales bacterium]